MFSCIIPTYDYSSSQVLGSCVQRRYSPHTRTYLGPGKIIDVMAAVNATNARTLVIDDDLTSKQQRNLEEALSANGGADVKVAPKPTHPTHPTPPTHPWLSLLALTNALDLTLISANYPTAPPIPNNTHHLIYPHHYLPTLTSTVLCCPMSRYWTAQL